MKNFRKTLAHVWADVQACFDKASSGKARLLFVFALFPLLGTLHREVNISESVETSSLPPYHHSPDSVLSQDFESVQAGMSEVKAAAQAYLEHRAAPGDQE